MLVVLQMMYLHLIDVLELLLNLQQPELPIMSRIAQVCVCSHFVFTMPKHHLLHICSRDVVNAIASTSDRRNVGLVHRVRVSWAHLSLCSAIYESPTTIPTPFANHLDHEYLIYR